MAGLAPAIHVYVPGACSEIVEEARIDGAPYLAVEILSKWTRSKDRVRKRNIYEREQVPHYLDSMRR